jgi:excisionase family DNA binding protein
MSDKTIVPPRGRALNFREACQYLGMDAKRLRRLVATNRVPHFKVGRLLFMERDLDEWQELHRTTSCQDAPVQKPRRVERPPMVERREPDLSALLPKRRRLTH